MTSRRWLVCLWVLALSADIATGRGRVWKLPVLQEAKAMLSRGVVVIGMPLALMCAPLSCGSDSEEIAEVAVIKENSSSDTQQVRLEGAYALADYLGNYVAYVNSGDGAIVTGYAVGSYGERSLKLELSGDNEGAVDNVSLGMVVGVMARNHPLVGAEVSFVRVHGAMQFVGILQIDDRLPRALVDARDDDDMVADRIYGTIDVVYIEPVLPEGSGAPTAVGITVQAADFGGRVVPAQMWQTVFLPFSRVELIDGK